VADHQVPTDRLLHAALLEAAAAHRDRTAIVDRDRQVTFAELSAAASRTCGWLMERGIGPGDRVMLLAENSADYLETALGVWMSGAVLATAYPSSARPELEYVLANSQPRLVLADAPRTAAILEARARDDRPDVHLLGDTTGGAPDAGRRDIRPDAAALICYTSGTTSRPKPVMHSHAGLLAATQIMGRCWHMSPEDRTLVCLPMAWVFGMVTASLVTLARGGAAVVLPRYNPVHVMTAIENEHVTVLPSVTTVFTKLVRYIEESDREFDTSSVRLCLAGGEPRNEPVFERWEKLSGCPVHDVYAATECFPVVTYDPIADPRPRRGSAGKVVPDAEMRLLDGAGRPVRDGEVGEAFWRGPGLMLGYNDEPELTSRALTDDGWYRTGDHVRVDADGYVYVVGRVSDMIIRGGSNVSPAEVEAALTQHPAIADAGVVGLPDPEYGELVATAIVTSDGHRLDQQEIADFLSTRLAAYKIPTLLQTVEELPRNATGKVARKLLADQLRAAVDADGSKP
jgi:long-chain acyl-CoA synthetase